MGSILELVLTELLRKEGVISDTQVDSIIGIKSLFGLLEEMKVVPPLSRKDIGIIKDWENLVSGRSLLKYKVKLILTYDLKEVENDTLRRILESLSEKVRGLVL